MDLSLESPLVPAPHDPGRPGFISGRPVDEWNAAYVRVESYFHALRVQNKVLLRRIVSHILKRAVRRAASETARSAMEIAAEEMDHLITEWFSEVLQESATGADHMLSSRGRLALFLADMPEKWQDQFLLPGPWPKEFVDAMRAAYLRAGPDFQLSQMTPRPLDLGPITSLTNLSRLPYFKMISAWLLFALLLILIFIFTH